MKTLFLIGILAALVVIATKKNDQTAIEAALEMGQKAQNIVAEFETSKAPVARPSNFKDTAKVPLKEDTSFIKKTKDALKNYKPKSTKPLEQPKQTVVPKEVSSPAAQKQRIETANSKKEPVWSLPRPQKTNLPDIPALPKATVEKVQLNDASTLELANAEPARVDVGQSYDLVKGYYENASRLLEEIK